MLLENNLAIDGSGHDVRLLWIGRVGLKVHWKGFGALMEAQAKSSKHLGSGILANVCS
jgi:hypothetical protein